MLKHTLPWTDAKEASEEEGGCAELISSAEWQCQLGLLIDWPAQRWQHCLC